MRTFSLYQGVILFNVDTLDRMNMFIMEFDIHEARKGHCGRQFLGYSTRMLALGGDACRKSTYG